MINGVKITLTICMTVLVSCALFIAYNEYTNRYSLVTSKDNSLYIFDKKNAILNRCSESGCELIETKLPSSSVSLFRADGSASKLFESDGTMSNSVVKAKASQENVNGTSGGEIKNEVVAKSADNPNGAQKETAQKGKDDGKPAVGNDGGGSNAKENSGANVVAENNRPAETDVKKEVSFAG
jgi:hypothetical protein